MTARILIGDTMPTRPVLRWHGGKWTLALWVISHFPMHRVYVEAFGGAASVLLRKPRAYAEVYNDLDDEVVNLFRVLQSADGARLRDLLELTPYAEQEFRLAYERSDDPVERARRLVLRSFLGFGTNAHTFSSNGFRSNTRTNPTSGFRANSNRSGTVPAHDWVNYPAALDATIARFKGVTIQSRHANRVLSQHDSPTTLHYVDPPYLPETRSNKNPYCKKHMYTHEIDRDGHVELLGQLRGLAGMVILSGYPSKLYDGMLPGWRKSKIAALADGARKRTEVLWLNPACVAALERDRAQKHMFDLLEPAPAQAAE